MTEMFGSGGFAYVDGVFGSSPLNATAHKQWRYHSLRVDGGRGLHEAKPKTCAYSAGALEGP